MKHRFKKPKQGLYSGEYMKKEETDVYHWSVTVNKQRK